MDLSRPRLSFMAYFTSLVAVWVGEFPGVTAQTAERRCLSVSDTIVLNLLINWMQPEQKTRGCEFFLLTGSSVFNMCSLPMTLPPPPPLPASLSTVLSDPWALPLLLP